MTAPADYRHVPYDIEIEQALIGSLLLDNGLVDRLIGRLRPEHFYDPLHQRLYEAMLRKIDRGVAATPLTINAALKADAGMVEVGGHAYLAGLAEGSPALPNVTEYATILRECAIRRGLIRIGEDIVNAAYDAPRDRGPDAIADGASEQLYRIAHEADGQTDMVPLIDLAHQAVRMAEQALHEPALAYISTGLAPIDDSLGPLFRTDLTVLGGATSMAKTALLQQMLLHAARQDFPALFFSLEMPGVQIANRYVAQEAKAPSDRIRRGKLSVTEFERVGVAPDALAMTAGNTVLPFWIDDSAGLSVAKMRAKANALQRKLGRKLGVIGIDHLQFVEPADARAEERDQLRQITKDLKSLAKDFDCAVCLISHITKENERRQTKRPVLADLYGSSGIQQNADQVWFVYREEYYLEREPPDLKDEKQRQAHLQAIERARGKAEVYSAKNRLGKLGTAHLTFNPALTLFGDPDDNGQTGIDFAALANEGRR